MFSLTMKVYKTTMQLLSAAVLTVAAASAQCNTGFGPSCTGLVTPNSEYGPNGNTDGNWQLSIPDPTTPSNPSGNPTYIADPCKLPAKDFVPAWVDTPDGSPPVFGYWSVDNAASEWISPYDEVNQPGGLFIYKTTFATSAATTLHISLRLQSDNETYSIYGYGNPKKGCQPLAGNQWIGSAFSGAPVNCPTCFQTWTHVNLAPFHVLPSSTASLYVIVRNRGVGGLDTNPTPSGLRIEFAPATGSNYTQSASADFNGDGQTDLAVVDNGTDKVAVYLNTKGEFSKAKEYAVGADPVYAASADLNGDGRPDLVVANYQSGTVSVLMNSGTGTFKNQVSYAAGSGPVAVAIGDLNGDGIPDLAVANVGGTVTILLGSGGGVFQAAQTISVGDPTASSPSSIAIGDVNGDGIPDLVMTDGSAGTLITVLGVAGGGFQAPITSESLFIEPGSIALADLNGDGILDAVLDDPAGGQVATMYSNGDGTFTFGQAVAAGTNPQGLIVTAGGSTGATGYNLVVADPASNDVTFLTYNSSGLSVVMSASGGSTPVAVAAVSNSTGTDVAVVSNGDSKISVLPLY